MASIFLVDDEPYIQELYRDLLERTGHKVVEIAYNGEEAVLKFELFKDKPDLTIMDHRMPIKNGYEATREILAMDPSAKILVISADPTVSDKVLRIGAAGFIEKPFEMVLLLETIDWIVSQPPPAARPRSEGQVTL